MGVYMSNEIKISHCKRCGRVLRNKESIIRGYGPTCYRLSQQKELESEITSDFNLKSEIDFLKCEVKMLKRMLRHVKCNTIHNNNVSDPIERIKRDEHRPERNESKISMSNVIGELKSLFKNGNYRDLLIAVPANELLQTKTMMECVI